MNKKGFTLIELLAILTTTLIIGLLVIPYIIDLKKNKENEKAVCNYNYGTLEYNINKIIYEDKNIIRISYNNKIIELSKSNCYLINRKGE